MDGNCKLVSFLLYRQMEKQSGGVFQRCTGKFREAADTLTGLPFLSTRISWSRGGGCGASRLNLDGGMFGPILDNIHLFERRTLHHQDTG